MILDDLPPRPDILRDVARYNMPHRVAAFEERGTSLVMGRREGYRIWDVDGREFSDFHLNGGVFNLGHRHPRLTETLRSALDVYDMGNHHLASGPRAALAQLLAHQTPGDLTYSVFAPSGGEAIDVAIKSARRATGRRIVVSMEAGYHGRSGISGAVGNPGNARSFLSDAPDQFVTVPFDDLDALEAALAAQDVAAVVVEMIPATAGFPLPSPEYFPELRRLCDRFGAMFVADEVQTGMGRTGALWACDTFGVVPDILVAGKGLGGGLYPVGVAVHTPAAGAWLRTDGWGYVSSAGGAELGAVVALEALTMTTEAAVQDQVKALTAKLSAHLRELLTSSPFLADVRQCGLVIGLVTSHPSGGRLLAKALYQRGLWAYPAGGDLRVLQFKPGLLLSDAECDRALEQLDAALDSLAADGSPA